MNDPKFEPKAPKPSILPASFGVQSIRALAHTLRPSTEPAPGAPPPRRGTAGLLAVAVVLAAAAGVGVAWLAGSRVDKQEAKLLKKASVHVMSGAQPRLSKSGKPERWKRAEVVVHIDGSVDRLGPWARSAVQTAFGPWVDSGAELPNLRFDSTNGATLKLEPDGKNTVIVAPITVPGHEKDLAITIGFADQESGTIVEADIVISPDYQFVDVEGSIGRATLAQGRTEAEIAGLRERDACKDPPPPGCPRVFDLQGVLTHEAGHFYGLGEEKQKPGDAMFFCTAQCETKKRTLTNADRDAVAELYVGGIEDPEVQAAGCGGGATIAGAPDPGALVSVLLTAGALFAARRRRLLR